MAKAETVTISLNVPKRADEIIRFTLGTPEREHKTITEFVVAAIEEKIEREAWAEKYDAYVRVSGEIEGKEPAEVGIPAFAHA